MSAGGLVVGLVVVGDVGAEGWEIGSGCVDSDGTAVVEEGRL